MKRGVDMYFITTLRILDTVVDDCRTVGYYTSYSEAYDCCKFNRCDIFEYGYYTTEEIESYIQNDIPLAISVKILIFLLIPTLQAG